MKTSVVLCVVCVANGLFLNAQAPLESSKRLRSSEVTDMAVSFLEHQLTEAANAMPQDKYAFAPTDGAFEGVRTFAQQVKHLAATNYILAAGILGEAPPESAGDETGPSSVRSKADILGYLKGSFAALHKAAATIDDENRLIPRSPISPLGRYTTRLGLAQEALIHMYDHYGQMVVYLRMNGVIPPASRR